LTAESSDGRFLNLSSRGFFLDTWVKFSGTKNAFSQVTLSDLEFFPQSEQEGLPNKCWLLAFTVKSVSKYKKTVTARKFISMMINKQLIIVA
jgi:hypothetical protein